MNGLIVMAAATSATSVVKLQDTGQVKTLSSSDAEALITSGKAKKIEGRMADIVRNKNRVTKTKSNKT